MNYRRPSLSHITHSTSITSVAIGCCSIMLGQLMGCGDSGGGRPIDPNQLQDNFGGSAGSLGSAGSMGLGGSGGLAGSAGTTGLGGSSFGGSAGTSNGPSALDVELYQGFHTDEVCATGEPTRQECLDDCTLSYNECYSSAAGQSSPGSCDLPYYNCQNACPIDSGSAPRCIYANVYFLVSCEGANVNDLAPGDVQVVIGDRDVGVEGAVLLTQQNGLQVDLLLDRSYSITEANSAQTVRDAARGFLDALPDEARVRVSAFASEPQVPQVLGSNGSSYYYEIGTEAATLENIIATGYAPYAVASSSAFTKLFDAAVGLAVSAESDDTTTAALPSIGVIFTDGADTASTQYETAASARTAITSANGRMKVYAIGLGNAVDENSLRTLSQDRAYSASDESTLVDIFGEVASALGAIYRYRVLVPSVTYQAPGVLTVDACDETSVHNFTMDSINGEQEDPDGPPSPEDYGDTCTYAQDGECDEPNLCPPGTDASDCRYE